MRSMVTAGGNTARGVRARAGGLAAGLLTAWALGACGTGTSSRDPDARPFDPGDARARDAVSETSVDVATAYDGPSVDVSPLDVPADDAAMGAPADATPGADAGGFDAGASLESGAPADASGADEPFGGDVGATRDAGFDSVSAADAISLRDVMPSSQCVDVAEAYAQLVVEAQSCSRGTQCAYPMCETLCCSCRVLVNPLVLDQRRALELQAEWTRMRCSDQLACAAARCETPVRGDCSSAGRCVTIRSGG